MITQEQINKQMDDYGNIRYMLEDLKSSKETLYLQILSKYPEALQEIQDMEEEVNGKIKEAEKAEKKNKKDLESMLEEYIQTLVFKDETEIKSKLIRVGVKREPEYDLKALDGMAVENPKLLAFRKEKIKTRITLNSK